ncbi:hypothetical protein NP493_71g05051 [Ridgeia piscesae]|uniref:Uncharacterized protein n=1 Tax=Ridgeia piscesae TaxID=27915 RepID=A0AAD9P9L4_RIDPI|nr:hypothetical protein NP493_71g05051 [Ridgeia piscesae]
MHCSIHLPRRAPGRWHFSAAGQRQKQQGRHAVTGYKSRVNWRMLACHGLSPMIVAVPLDSHHPPPAGQPQPVGVDLPQSACFSGCLELKCSNCNRVCCSRFVVYSHSKRCSNLTDTLWAHNHNRNSIY